MAAGETRSYIAEMPNSAPDYLREWAEKRTWPRNCVIFRAGWVYDWMTEHKERAAECYCTACGSKFYAGWRSGGCRGAGCGIYIDGQGEIGDGGRIMCPECGTVLYIAHVHGDAEYAAESEWPMTLGRIREPGKPDRLTITVWICTKYFDNHGSRHIRIRPWEAVVVEETRIVCMRKHRPLINGRQAESDWRQKKDAKDTIRDIRVTVCPEGILQAVTGTTAENAKLELYMQDGAICFPVAYIRLWQRRKTAETLLTCGAGNILRALIGQEKLDGGSYRAEYGTAGVQLRGAEWKAKRPAEILRMEGRGELREMIALQAEHRLGGKTWQQFLAARRSGWRWTPDDLLAAERLSLSKPVQSPAKVERYMDSQKRRHGEDRPDVRMLLDYWAMRDSVPEELRGEEFPENLKREHDLAVLRKKETIHRELETKFAARAKALSRYAWEENGILIRPPENEGELIKEGKLLSHCVATYAQRHAEGKTAILLIRRIEDPEMPWYTLNLDEQTGTVIQNRGLKNCERTPEVARFEADWLAHIHKHDERRDIA